jgi:hypothetical protein
MLRRLSRNACLLLCLAVSTAVQALPNESDLDAVLVRNVRNGSVDYDGIRADPAFARYVVGIGTARRAELVDRNTRLSFLINAYNALAIQGILNGGSPSSWLGRYRFFKRDRYRVLGEEMSLETLEHGELLPLGDARVHFAIVCASLSCPRLWNRAFTAVDLDRQLEDAAGRFANDLSRNRYDPGRKLAFLSRIFAWYAADFEKSGGSVQKYLAKYVTDPEIAALLSRDAFAVQYIDYDWGLNGVYRGVDRGASRQRE